MHTLTGNDAAALILNVRQHLLEFCRGRTSDVLRFTRDPRIWPTNKISEHGVR